MGFAHIPNGQIRLLAISLLNTEEGISEESYNLLTPLMDLAGNCDDIMCGVDATDGRFYLPEGWVDENHSR